jgi:hypothetical protein
MELELAPQEYLSPLEALLSIYTPILECLVSHLPTPSKLALAQTSSSLRHLLHSYPRFFAHLDYRLPVIETPNVESYQPGTVYNLDRLLQSLPVHGRIISLTLDWTAISGSFLFNKILDRCSHTLEHLSVRGCRKVSIKHHIVPHFVYQSSILQLGDHEQERQQKPALKSLYVYKARGVRRKPFLIDRKPADGDEPSRYLTTLAEQLGIWVDLGLCPTPKLRCPRRREILRRWKENFCVPFDRRWRAQNDNESLSEVEHFRRLRREQNRNERLTCSNCDAAIPDRCEACVHQMTCISCQKPLCHNCAYVSRTAPSQQSTQIAVATNGAPATWAAVAANGLLMQQNQQQQGEADSELEAELPTAPSLLLTPCCKTILGTHADNLCESCYANVDRASCSLCEKALCIKHELSRCRRCEGGCGKIFCFTTDLQDPGCGEPGNGRAQIKDCLGCGIEVCGSCRASPPCNAAQSPSPSPVPSSEDDEDGSESTLSAGDGGGGGHADPAAKNSCNCRSCIQNYYCPTCWPTKPIPCEPRPIGILKRRHVMSGDVTLLQIGFEGRAESTRWYTSSALAEHHPAMFPQMMDEFKTRRKMKGLHLGPGPEPEEIDSEDAVEGLADLIDEIIEVAASEYILEKVLAVKSGGEDSRETQLMSLVAPLPAGATDGAEALVLCKWLGKGMTDVTWVKNESLKGPREARLVEDFIVVSVSEMRMTERRWSERDGDGLGTGGDADDGGEGAVLI